LLRQYFAIGTDSTKCPFTNVLKSLHALAEGHPDEPATARQLALEWRGQAAVRRGREERAAKAVTALDLMLTTKGKKEKGGEVHGCF